MAVADLTKPKQAFSTDRDNIVVVENIASIRGGRTLDVTGWQLDYIPAGHPIIVDNAGNYKPFPLTGSTGSETLGSLPAEHKYAGALVATIGKDLPFAGIMYHGTLNHKAMQFDPTAILEAWKADCKDLTFRSDKQ